MIYENITVGQKENSFLCSGFPKAPDDLEGRERLSGACCHHKQHTFLTFCDGFDGSVDGGQLIVARSFILGTWVVILGVDTFLFRIRDSFVLAVTAPQFLRSGELDQRELAFDALSPIVFDESVASTIASGILVL